MRSNANNFSPFNLLASISFSLLFLFTALTPAQGLPDKIQGYKVHKTDIIVGNTAEGMSDRRHGDAVVNIDDPKLVGVSLTGITLSVSAQIKAPGQSGKIDFLTFRGFHVNGIPVEIENYTTPFLIKKNEPAVLPKPAILFLPTEQIVNAAWKEFSGSKEKWTVTGTVFVFGKFRKAGFNFKRAVPVKVNITIRNPLL